MPLHALRDHDVETVRSSCEVDDLDHDEPLLTQRHVDHGRRKRAEHQDRQLRWRPDMTELDDELADIPQYFADR